MALEKILVIDDDPDKAALAVRLLKMELPTSEVVELRDPDALDEALSSTSYDLVLTDNHFSWGNGMLVLSLVRRHLPGCPVVMLTGRGSEEVACEAIKKGFSDYLPATARGYLMLGKRVRDIVAAGHQTTTSGLVAQYDRLLELLDEAVFVATREGLLLQVNSAFSRLLDCPNPEKVRGRRLADFLSPDALSGVLDALDPSAEPRDVQVSVRATGQSVGLKLCLFSQGDRLPTLLVGRIQPIGFPVSASKSGGENTRPSHAETGRRITEVQLEKNRHEQSGHQPNAWADFLRNGEACNSVDLEKVLDLVLADLRPILEQAKATVVRGKLPALAGNHLDMIRLFENLLSSIVRLRTREPLEIDVTAHRMPVEWLFIVRDTGSRIVEVRQELASPENLGDEPLGSSKGLTVCREIIERQGGRLWVAFESEAGSTIYFTLPTEDETLQQEHVDGRAV